MHHWDGSDEPGSLPLPTQESGLQSLSQALPAWELLLHNDTWVDKGL